MLKTPEKIRAGRASGFSLVELMISITVGLVVLGGVVSIFSSSVKGNADALKMTRLNQELQAAMGMMTRDIRRAGYWGNASSAIGPSTSNANPFTLDTPGNYSGETNASCITFSYDTNDNGSVTTLPPDERFGFRLNSGALEARQSGNACTDTGWVNITDENSVQITTLLFELKAQPPILIISNVMATTPATSTINVREVRITMQGRLKNDTNVTRTLQETVRIRSDRWAP